MARSLHLLKQSVSQFVTYIRARDLLADAGKELLVEVLRDLPKYQKNAKPLDLSQGSLAPKFTKKQAKISWRNQTAGDIMRQHRAIGYKVSDVACEMAW